MQAHMVAKHDKMIDVLLEGPIVIMKVNTVAWNLESHLMSQNPS